MAFAAAPALAQTLAPAAPAAAPARGPQTNWWSQAGGEDGQEPKVLSRGWAFNVAPRLSYCMETAGTEPVVYYRNTPAGQAPSYPESETPTPTPGYKYIKTKITSTGGYDSFNVPFFNVTE